MTQKERTTASNVVDYYTRLFDENKRLGFDCDNRHVVEREVKTRIISSLVEDNRLESVLEIGAGTGIYSIMLAKNHNVTACDLVPSNINKLNENADKSGVSISTDVCNAMSLPYKDNSFDLVMLSGPIYHLHDNNDKLKALREAKRVLKPYGFIVIDFLPRIHSFFQMSLRYDNFLSDSSKKDIEMQNCKDDMFSYDDMRDIRALALSTGLIEPHFYGTDSITRFIRDDVNKFSSEKLSKYIDYVYSISSDASCCNLSEHALCIAIKEA